MEAVAHREAGMRYAIYSLGAFAALLWTAVGFAAYDWVAHSSGLADAVYTASLPAR